MVDAAATAAGAEDRQLKVPTLPIPPRAAAAALVVLARTARDALRPTEHDAIASGSVDAYWCSGR